MEIDYEEDFRGSRQVEDDERRSGHVIGDSRLPLLTEERCDINEDGSSWPPSLTQIGMSSTGMSFVRRIKPRTDLQKGSELSE